MKRFTSAFACLILLSAIGQANADTLTFSYMMEYSGGTPPAGSPPWLTATFDDGGTPGTVELTLAATNLTDDEFVRVWMFNLDPTLDPTALNFAKQSTTGSFDDPVISTGVDAFHAGGDGLYDFQFEFATSGGTDARFGMGDTYVTEISGIGSLTASSFDFESAPKGSSNGPFWSVAHIQAIGEEDMDSGWITAPEPSSFVISVIALVALAPFACRRRAGIV